MVEESPRFTEVCQSFHRFCQGAVLVAHNAPFDMAFLHKEAARGAPAFDHPVLDTVHLSAIIFGGSATHTLDALCERLDIAIAPERRHTALGDAMATAEALVAMLPVLDGLGLNSFDLVQAEARKHSRIVDVV
jgi:DNA polymerase-3 subunit epsilon